MAELEPAEGEQARRALRAAAPELPGDFDPVALRRAGDARRRTRTAVRTSLAFSLVIFGGMGAVYEAAHRTRPATLGSDVQARPRPRAAAPGAATVVAGFERPVVAGHKATLRLTGTVPGGAGYESVLWGDGQTSTQSLVRCEPVRPAPPVTSVPRAPEAPVTVTTTFVHTYSAPGRYRVQVTLTPSCARGPSTAFDVDVEPAAG